jgi:hypothetical protein
MSINRRCAIHTLPERVDIVVPERRRCFRKSIPEKTITFAWHGITEVCVFKRDCYTVDQICMIFELNRTETVTVSEDMDGWSELVTAIPVYLPGALTQDGWWDKVVSPAFELCITKIYPHPS